MKNQQNPLGERQIYSAFNLSVSEALLLRQVGGSLEMGQHGVSVMEKHGAGLAVERSQSLFVLPGDLQALSW